MPYFLVNHLGYIFPATYNSLDDAAQACGDGEEVYFAESMTELEECIEQWED